MLGTIGSREHRGRIFVLLAGLGTALSACATSPARPPAAGCPVCAPSAAPTAPVAAQESLADYVPANAVAALVVRRNALAYPRSFLAERPDLQRELSQFLVAKLGVDLTAVDGAVGFMTAFDANAAAFFLRIPLPAKIDLKGRVVEHHRGLPLVVVERDLLAAAVPGGLLLGNMQGLKNALAAWSSPPAMDPTRSVKPVLAKIDPTVEAVLAVKAQKLGDRELDGFVEKYGITSATATFGADHVLTVRLEGDPRRLAALIEVIHGLESMGLAGMEMVKSKAVAGDSVTEAVGAILTTQETKRMFAELEPRVQGDALVSRYHVKEGMVSTYALGVAAAVAIPSFTRYVKQSRTAEATANLKAIGRAALALRASHGGARFAFPETTPWTPTRGCCGQPDNRCSVDAQTWSHATWMALGFAPAGPLNYQYRFVRSGKGKSSSFTVEARGDLDCNGVWSGFSLKGKPDEKGELGLGTIESTNALE
jgi:hypothetical protein